MITSLENIRMIQMTSVGIIVFYQNRASEQTMTSKNWRKIRLLNAVRLVEKFIGNTEECIKITILVGPIKAERIISVSVKIQRRLNQIEFRPSQILYSHIHTHTHLRQWIVALTILNWWIFHLPFLFSHCICLKLVLFEKKKYNIILWF